MRRRDQLAAAAAALGRRRRRRAARAGHRRRRGPARRRREPAGPPRGLHPVRAASSRCRCSRRRSEVATGRGSAASGCSSGAGPGATNHFEGGGFVRSQRRRGLPEPDVPLPAARDPLRRLGAGRRARLPGARRADVLRRARLGAGSRATDPRVHPALRFNYLSTEQDRREWVEAVRVARDILSQPAFDAVQRRRDCRPGRRSRPTRRSSTGSRATPRRRCTRRARPDGRSTTMSVVDPLTMRRPRPRGAAGRRRLGVAVRHQRQHLRAGDDGRREGRRPDPRATRRSPPSASTSTATATACRDRAHR